MLFEESVCVEQDIVEVHGLRVAASLLVSEEDFGESRHPFSHIGLHVRGVVFVLLGIHQLVLGIGDTIEQFGWFIEFVVELHLLDDGLDERLAVSGIIDREIVAESDSLVLGPEYS